MDPYPTSTSTKQEPNGSGSTHCQATVFFLILHLAKTTGGRELLKLYKYIYPIKKYKTDPEQTGTQRRAPQDPDPQHCQQAILSDPSPD
jgi:hypothetical protein